MKHLFTFILACVMGFGIHAQQVDRDMVVVEGGTGFW